MKRLLVVPLSMFLVVVVASDAHAQCYQGACGQPTVGVLPQPVVVVQPAQPTVVVIQQPLVVQQPAVVVQQQPIVVQQRTVQIGQPLVVEHAEPMAVPEPQAASSEPPPAAVPQPEVAPSEPSTAFPALPPSFRDWYLSRPPVRGRGPSIGLRSHVARTAEDEVTLYGGGGVFRYIGRPRVGLELAIDGSVCEDEVIIPIELSVLFFLNTRGRLQPYLLAGLGVTAASRGDHEVTLVYTGGLFGVGVEILIGRHLGLTFDARSFVQGETSSSEENPLRYGVTFNTGFNFYFARHNDSARREARRAARRAAWRSALTNRHRGRPWSRHHQGAM